MPIREYECQACHHRYETLERSSDGKTRDPCPECGSKKIERLLSVFAARQGESAPGRADGGGDCPRCGLDGPCQGGF